MPSNMLVTADPTGDTIQRLKQAMASPVNGSVVPTLVIDFSCITSVRIMINAWRQQISETGDKPVNLVLDMTRLDEIGSWDQCLSGVFDTRVFGAAEKLPETWHVALVIPAVELNHLPACSSLATVIIDGSKRFDRGQLFRKSFNTAGDSLRRMAQDHSVESPSP